jgi:hypothetical protein
MTNFDGDVGEDYFADNLWEGWGSMTNFDGTVGEGYYAPVGLVG